MKEWLDLVRIICETFASVGRWQPAVFPDLEPNVRPCSWLKNHGILLYLGGLSAVVYSQVDADSFAHRINHVLHACGAQKKYFKVDQANLLYLGGLSAVVYSQVDAVHTKIF